MLTPKKAARDTADTVWSPTAGLSVAREHSSKKKAKASSSTAEMLQIYLIATVNSAKMVEQHEARAGCTLVINAPIGPEEDRKKFERQLRTALTAPGLCLLKEGWMPFFNGPDLAVHAESDSYGANQLPDWKTAIGLQMVLFNKAHGKRVRAAAIKEFPSVSKDVYLDQSYVADNDPTVALVQVRKVDGTLFNGEGTDGFVLDTCGKRSLMLYYSILNAAGIKLTEVTWPEAIGGQTATYFATATVARDDIVTLLTKWEIPYTVVP